MRRPWIRFLQLVSISLMWAFALGVLVFVPWLVFVATRWHDAENWSLVISIVMTPVYLSVAATLTYVYVGLRRGMSDTEDDEGVKPDK